MSSPFWHGRDAGRNFELQFYMAWRSGADVVGLATMLSQSEVTVRFNLRQLQEIRRTVRRNHAVPKYGLHQLAERLGVHVALLQAVLEEPPDMQLVRDDHGHELVYRAPAAEPPATGRGISLTGGLR